MLIDRILAKIAVGTKIPKPRSTGEFVFKGECEVDGERGIRYSIPSKTKSASAQTKRLSASQLESAYRELRTSGEISKSWWTENVASSSSEGGCNFTTFGGLLILLKEAERAPNGYRLLRAATT
jgi:hypothetical protein